MHDPNQEHQWDVRAAYRKGWEERMAYYDRLLRSMMELIEGSVRIMKVDGMSEAIEDLDKALLLIENAWAQCHGIGHRCWPPGNRVNRWQRKVT
jgi:hypothetical protein